MSNRLNLQTRFVEYYGESYINIHTKHSHILVTWLNDALISFSRSRNSTDIKEHKGSILHISAIWFYSKLNPFPTSTEYLFEIGFNIIFQTTPTLYAQPFTSEIPLPAHFFLKAGDE